MGGAGSWVKCEEILPEGGVCGKRCASSSTVTGKPRCADCYRRKRKEEADKRSLLPDGSTVADSRVSSVEIEFADRKKPRSDWREIFAHAETGAKIAEESETGQDSLTARVDCDGPLVVCFSSDWHLGSVSVDYSAWKSHIETILTTPNVVLATVGDLIENTRVFKNVGHVWEQSISPDLQAKALGSLFGELADAKKILCASWGNHDSARDERQYGCKIVQDIQARHVPFFRGRGRLKLSVGPKKAKARVAYEIEMTHAARFNSYLNPTHSAGQILRTYAPDADVVVTAHTHAPAISWLTAPSGRPAILIRCGTFKTGSGDLLSARYFRPGVLGTPTIVFHGDRQEAVAFASLGSAIRYANSPSV